MTILATTVGEAAAEVVSTQFNRGLVVTSYVTAAPLIIALVAQFRTDRYVRTVYWITVEFFSAAGTLIPDNFIDNIGVNR